MRAKISVIVLRLKLACEWRKIKKEKSPSVKVKKKPGFQQKT